MTGTPAADDVLLRADLVAHQLQGLDPGPDEHDARRLARPREVRVLGEEPVAGVDRVGAARTARPRSPRRSTGRTRCGSPTSARATWSAARSASVNTATDRIPSVLERRDDPAGDLPPVGHQHGPEHRRSHPEEPEAGLSERDACAHVEGHAEHPPGVRGVDDPVVPQPRGRVVRAPLRLVLLPQRRLERLLVLRRTTGRPAARGGRSPAPTTPARRPSPRSGWRATSTGTAGRTPARTWSSCPPRTSRRSPRSAWARGWSRRRSPSWRRASRCPRPRSRARP